MGCTVREEQMSQNRRAEPSKPDSGSTDKDLGHKPSLYPVDFKVRFNESFQNPNSNSGSDDGGWAFCIQEQLEELMLKKLDRVYEHVILRLGALGYDEKAAFNAVLRYGHCFGGLDVVENIFQNSLAYLKNRAGADDGHVCGSMRKWKEDSLADMVSLMRIVKPHVTRGDALWSLFVTQLHVGQAMLLIHPQDLDGNGNSELKISEKLNNKDVRLSSALDKFSDDLGYENEGPSDFVISRVLYYADQGPNLEGEMEFPKWFTPELKVLMKENVAMFAAGYQANVKKTRAHDADLSTAAETIGEAPLSPESTKRQEIIHMMLRKLGDMNLDGDEALVTEDQRVEMILSLVRQIKDLERRVKERKEWAQAKAMQAARKLSHDLNELRMLRMEREKIRRMMQGKPTPEDPTLKKLAEMDHTLREAGIQADHVNAAVRRLEKENAEMRAEIEASKLSASESLAVCLEVARRVKKYLKKLSAWDKQRAKLQQDIATEKQRMVEVEEEMLQVEQAKKAAEAKWREVQNAREQVEEERRLKEATEADTRRKQEALRSKFELDIMRQKDEVRRLEDELARLTSQDESEIINQLFGELQVSDTCSVLDYGVDRQCVICVEEEASVVFLPCGHQVVCGRCNEAYGEATCPVCKDNIDERVRVFGAM